MQNSVLNKSKRQDKSNGLAPSPFRSGIQGRTRAVVKRTSRTIGTVRQMRVYSSQSLSDRSPVFSDYSLVDSESLK